MELTQSTVLAIQPSICEEQGNISPKRLSPEKSKNKNTSPSSRKKIAKAPILQSTKQTRETELKKGVELTYEKAPENKVLHLRSSKQTNLINEKHVPIMSPDPNSYTGILRKDHNHQQNFKALKVTFDENLNSEHFLSLSDISSSQSSNENEKESGNSAFLVVDRASDERRHIELPKVGDGNGKHLSPRERSKGNKKMKHLYKNNKMMEQKNFTSKFEEEIADLTNTQYTPITKLGFSKELETEDSRLSGSDLGLNSTRFYDEVFSGHSQKELLIKYAELPLEDWLTRGDNLCQEKFKIIHQIMSIRIRSSYVHQVLTQHLNERAEALQEWEKTEKTNEEVINQIKAFLEKKH